MRILNSKIARSLKEYKIANVKISRLVQKEHGLGFRYANKLQKLSITGVDLAVDASRRLDEFAAEVRRGGP